MPQRPKSRAADPPRSGLPDAPFVCDLAEADSRHSPRQPFCLHEHHNDLVVHVPAAGFRNDELEVLVNQNYLMIRGHRRRPLRTARKAASASARTNGTDAAKRGPLHGEGFRRIIRLPVDVRSEEAVATLRDGLLTVVVPIR